MNGTPTAPELLEAARQGDNRACEQVLEENAGLIWSIVRRYYGRGVEPDDLYQLGCLGFLKAVRGFDPSFGTQFSTYAVPKIAGEIRRFLRDDGTVKVSRGMKERGAAVWGARRRLVAEMGREPTLSELAAETGLTPEEIAAAETASDAVASLQAETGEGGLTLEGMLGHRRDGGGRGGAADPPFRHGGAAGAGTASAAAALLQKPHADPVCQSPGGLPSPDLTVGAAGGGPAAEDPVRGRSVLRLLCPRRGRKIMGCRLRKKSLEDFFPPAVNTPGPYHLWYGPGVFTE